MIDIQTMVRPLNYSAKDTLRIIKENCTPTADGKCPAISAAERRAGIARCYLSKLTGKLIEKEQQLSAAVTIGWGTYKATIDTGATASFLSKELADNLTALGKITRTRRQVRLGDGRCGVIDEQLEVEIAFGNKRLSMSLLILPGVVDSLVLGWNFLTQVCTEIKCAGHEVIIPARNRHKGWLEEKLSVQRASEDDDTTKFLEAELSSFNRIRVITARREDQGRRTREFGDQGWRTREFGD